MSFEKELENLLNKYSMENNSNTPDFILAIFLCGCLTSFNRATKDRTKWYDADGEVQPSSAISGANWLKGTLGVTPT